MGSADTVTSWIGAVARSHPNDPALVCDGEVWTYGELWRRSALLARDLLARGLDEGQPVGIVGENEAAYVAVYLAILRAGGIAVPINTMLDWSSIRAQLNLVGARLVFVGRLAPEVREGLEESFTVVRFSDSPTGGVSGAPLPTISPDSFSSIMLTSGSTGRPKGVVHSHASLFHACLLLAGAFPYGRAERNVAFLPFYTAIPEQVLTTLCTGGSLEILPGFDVDRVADACTRATTFDAVPTILSRLIEHAPLDKLANLKWILFASEVMPVDLLRRWWEELPGVGTHQFYGMTEVLPLTAASDAVLRAEPGTIGRAFPTTGLSVRPVDDGASGSGELVASSPARMLGYFNDPAATEVALTAAGEMRTGDLGRIDDRGLVFLTGRLKDIIITGGLNVAPAEIEAVASGHRAVQQVVVVGVPSERWGETPVVVAVARPQHVITAEDLLEYCRSNLTSFKRPSGAAVVSSLPTTGIGKLDKATVKTMIANGEIKIVGV